MKYILCINIKLLLFRMYISLNDRSQIVQNIRQMYRCIFNPDRTTLDPAHIQHIIDQTEQMLTGCMDLFQIIQNKLFTANMCCCKCSKSDDCIHWCTDVMRHIIQKCCLRLVRMFCSRKRISQILILLYLSLFFFCHITVRDQDCTQFSFFIISLRHNDERQPSSIHRLSCKTQCLAFLQALRHRAHIDEFPICFLKWFCNDLLYHFFQVCSGKQISFLIRLHVS